MGAESWLQLGLATLRLGSFARLAQEREFTCVVSSAANERRALHVDGDGMYITGSFTVSVKRVRAVKFLCYDNNETIPSQSI